MRGNYCEGAMDFHLCVTYETHSSMVDNVVSRLRWEHA